MRDTIITTTIKAVIYVALAAAILSVGLKGIPFITDTVTEILVNAAKAGENQ